jgi:hypothetical protein
VAGIPLPSPFLGEGFGVRVINHLCHYFRKMVLDFFEIKKCQSLEGSGVKFLDFFPEK